MAEIVVQPFVSFVVERLDNLLIQEYRLLHGVRAQVEQMQKELSRMQCFLKAADTRRGEGDELVSNCISEIRELSLDAEDVIATFVIKVALMRRGRIHHMLKRYFCIFSESRARHTVGLEIEYPLGLTKGELNLSVRVSDELSALPGLPLFGSEVVGLDCFACRVVMVFWPVFSGGPCELGWLDCGLFIFTLMGFRTFQVFLLCPVFCSSIRFVGFVVGVIW